MRITNKIMIFNLKNYLQQGMEALDKFNRQLATGKRFNLPSEDPIATQRSMSLNSALASNQQYQKNIGYAQDWLLNTEAAIQEVIQILQRSHELAVRGANGTLSREACEAIADEIDQLNDHLLQLANTKVAGKYIFSGTATDTRAFASITGDYNGDTNSLTTEINPGVTVDYNITGEKIFGLNHDPAYNPDNPVNGTLFDILAALSNNLRSGNQAAISNYRIGELNRKMDEIMSFLSEIGARTNRLELSNQRLTAEELNLNKLIANTEDVDMAKVIMNLKMQENVYRATLASGARIVQPTLIDFLK